MNGTFLWVGDEGFGTYRFADGQPMERIDAEPEGVATPGFVDLHVHGGYGVDFMASPPEDLARWFETLEGLGYSALLPTTVTASVSDVLAAFLRCPEHPLVAGFHLEGPFLSPKFPGAQPPHAIVDPSAGPSEWDAVLDDPRLRYITLAPERPGALELVQRLAERSITVSLGHTDATYEECQMAYDAGARHTTHTYNAMRGLHHREAGTVGFALAEAGVNAELIYDRVHVCREAAAILAKAKGADGLIAVSDATLAAGLPPGTRMTMWGLECTVDETSVRLADSGALAGSTITLLDAFRNLTEDFGAETAIRACSLNPWRVLHGYGRPDRILFFDSRLDRIA